MFGSCGTDRVDGHAERAVGSVLEAHGEGETGGEFSVQLGFGGSGTDGTEGDEIGEELGGDGVEHFTGDGHAHAGEVGVEFSRNPQALVNLVGLVDVWVVDQTFPTDGGPGLFQVGSHNDAEVRGELLGELL